MDKLNVGLIGLGTVGTGVAKIILEKASWLETRTGIPIRLKQIADIDMENKRDLALDGMSLTQNAEDIINDPEIQVVTTRFRRLATPVRLRPLTPLRRGLVVPFGRRFVGPLG